MIKDLAPLPGYPTETGVLCAILLDATEDWRLELDPNLGPEVTTWRVGPGGRSIGGIMLHMIIAEIFWFEMFALDRKPSADDKLNLHWDEIDVDTDKWPEPPAQPLSWYFELYDRYRARTLEAVKDWPSLDTLLPIHGDMRSLRWVFGHVIQHESYHGGQIVLMAQLFQSLSGSTSG